MRGVVFVVVTVVAVLAVLVAGIFVALRVSESVQHERAVENGELARVSTAARAILASVHDEGAAGASSGRWAWGTLCAIGDGSPDSLLSLVEGTTPGRRARSVLLGVVRVFFLHQVLARPGQPDFDPRFSDRRERWIEAVREHALERDAPFSVRHTAFNCLLGIRSPTAEDAGALCHHLEGGGPNSPNSQFTRLRNPQITLLRMALDVDRAGWHRAIFECEAFRSLRLDPGGFGGVDDGRLRTMCGVAGVTGGRLIVHAAAWRLWRAKETPVELRERLRKSTDPLVIAARGDGPMGQR
jgi:hypothetical protein